MSKVIQDIQRLLPVLEMAFQAEQLKMAQISLRINDLKRQIHEIERPEKPDPSEASWRTGADVLWEAWVKDHKVLINQELLLAYRDREHARGRLAKRLSKLEAARQLKHRVATNERKIAARRSNW